jgi:hypothetical protein
MNRRVAAEIPRLCVDRLFIPIKLQAFCLCGPMPGLGISKMSEKITDSGLKGVIPPNATLFFDVKPPAIAA